MSRIVKLGFDIGSIFEAIKVNKVFFKSSRLDDKQLGLTWAALNQGTPTILALIGGLLSIVWIATGPQASLNAQTIVLRDMTMLEDQVSSFDIDGVALQNGRRLLWSEIHRGSLGPERQAEFDRMLKEMGLPMLRLQTRVANQDFENVSELAEQLLRSNDSLTSHTARFATAAWCRGELALHRRESAAVALLTLLRIEQSLTERSGEFPFGSLPLEIDSETWICNDLLPIWFDQPAAKEAFARVQSEGLWNEKSGETAMIYAISLAIAAEHPEVSTMLEAAVRLDSLADSPWLKILRAQQSIQQKQFAEVGATLTGAPREIKQANQALILYYKGLAGLEDASPEAQQRAMLDLLAIPATVGDRFPELAAAALDRVIGSGALDHHPASVDSLRRELIRQYPNTFHAQKYLR